MEIRNDSIKQQNKLYDIKFAEVELIRKNNLFTLYIKKNKVNEYIDTVYILNDNMFYVHDSNENKWIAYKRIDNVLIELYRSVYLILLYPKLIIEYFQSVSYIHQAGLDYDNNIKPKSLLFVGEDFKISNGQLIVGNSSQLRVFRYVLKEDRYYTNIIQSNQNKIETKKNKIYFDNTGCLEIYSKRKNELLYNCNKFYKIYPYLYCLKTDDDKYIIYDVERAEEIFRGGALTYIEQFITLVSYNRNEIFVVDREKKLIRIYNWEKYRKGDTKEYISDLKIKKFGGE